MDLLSLHAAGAPDRPAVIDDRPDRPPIVWSFADLDRRAHRLSHLLAGLGAAPGTRVVGVGPNSAAMVGVTHAVRRTGATYVPLNYRLSAGEAAYVVDNSDATVVYADATYLPLIEAIRADTPKVRHVVVFDEAGELTDAGLAATLAAAPDDTPAVSDEVGATGGTMVYTSGTTGRPKGAVRGATGSPAASAQLMGLIELIGYVPEDVYLTTGPLYHSGPGGFAALAHTVGSTIVTQHHFDPEDWLRLVQTHRVTSTFTAPTPIRMVCNLPEEVKARYDRSSMRRMVANAAPWTMALKLLYLDDFPSDSLWEVYGSTELGVDCVLGPDDHLRKPGSCGRPAPGVEVMLLDEAGQAVTEPHVKGELYVRAAAMFSTYHKADDKYQADSHGDFHTVGDIAYRDEDGYVYIADRKKDMIITGGMNVYPAEVEAALDGSPDVYEAAVFGIPDDTWGETVHAVVVPARPGVDAGDIEGWAREHLAGYKVPRSVTFMDELPKTGSGKVLKRELRAPWWPAPST